MIHHCRPLLRFLGSLRALPPRQLRHHSPAFPLPLLPQIDRHTELDSWNRANVAPHISSFPNYSSMASPDGQMKEDKTGTSTEEGAETAKKNLEGNNDPSEEPDAVEDHDKYDLHSGEESEGEEKDFSSLLRQKEELVREKDRMIAEMKTKVLNNLAEVENIRGRTRRDAESIKKYAIENFATSLLDVADNLGRVAATVPGSVQNETLANDSSSHAKLLKSLLEGVDMTQRQLVKIFNKFGLQKCDPVGQKYDPSQHMAISEVQDSTKDPETIASVMKSGYMLHDKVIRHPEVGVVKAEVKAE